MQYGVPEWNVYFLKNSFFCRPFGKNVKFG